MAYAIVKHCAFGGLLVVTAIKRGGLSIDNHRTFPDGRLQPEHVARTFKSREAADKALASMATVGGFDDYSVLDLAEA